MGTRKNDANHSRKKFFRTNERFFQINGQWYFSAREGDIGPFRSRGQAVREAEAYIAARRAGEQARQQRRPGAREVTDPTVIPGYIYRSILSMEQRVDGERDLVLDIE